MKLVAGVRMLAAEARSDSSAYALLAANLIKTIADVVMHTVEHHALRASRPADGSQQTVASTTS